MQYKPQSREENRAMRQAIADMKKEYGKNFIEDMHPQYN